MEWRKFTRNLASEKLNCPFFRFPFIHTLPRFFPLSNYTTSFIDEENQNFGGGRNHPSWNSFSPFNPAPRNDRREEKRWPPPSEQRGRSTFNIVVKLGRNWFPLESLGLHLTNERNRGRGEQTKENKRLLRHLREPTWATNLSHDFD